MDGKFKYSDTKLPVDPVSELRKHIQEENEKKLNFSIPLSRSSSKNLKLKTGEEKSPLHENFPKPDIVHNSKDTLVQKQVKTVRLVNSIIETITQERQILRPRSKSESTISSWDFHPWRVSGQNCREVLEDEESDGEEDTPEGLPSAMVVLGQMNTKQLLTYTHTKLEEEQQEAEKVEEVISEPLSSSDYIGDRKKRPTVPQSLRPHTIDARVVPTLIVKNELSYHEESIRTGEIFPRKLVVGGTLHGLLWHYVRGKDDQFQTEFLQTTRFWCEDLQKLMFLIVECFRNKTVEIDIKKLFATYEDQKVEDGEGKYEKQEKDKKIVNGTPKQEQKYNKTNSENHSTPLLTEELEKFHVRRGQSSQTSPVVISRSQNIPKGVNLRLSMDNDHSLSLGPLSAGKSEEAPGTPELLSPRASHDPGKEPKVWDTDKFSFRKISARKGTLGTEESRGIIGVRRPGGDSIKSEHGSPRRNGDISEAFSLSSSVDLDHLKSDYSGLISENSSRSVLELPDLILEKIVKNPGIGDTPSVKKKNTGRNTLTPKASLPLGAVISFKEDKMKSGEKKKEKKDKKDRKEKEEKVKNTPQLTRHFQTLTDVSPRREQKKHDVVFKKPRSKSSDFRGLGQEPTAGEIRAIVEQAVAKKSGGPTSCFTVHMDAGQTTVLFQPTKKVMDVLRSICVARSINMEDFLIRETDGTLLEVNEETTMGSLGVMEVQFVSKNALSQDEATKHDPRTSLTSDQQGLLHLIMGWIKFDVHTFTSNPVRAQFDKLAEYISPDIMELINRMIRYKLAGIKDVKLLVAEIYSDQNKFSIMGKTLMEWLHNKGLNKADSLEILTHLLNVKLLIPKTETDDLKFNLNVKYRLMIKKKQIMKTKVQNLILIHTASPSEKDVLNFPVQMFARQLTYFELMLFKKIEPQEFVFWVKKLKGEEIEKMAPNLSAFIKHFNRMTDWVPTEIVTCPNIKRRQSLLKQYITIATECFKLKNYAAVLEIVSGLRHPAVSRMSLTWKLPEKYETSFKMMNDMASPEQNWKHWRNLVKETPDYVPYLGLFLSDLTFIKDGGGDEVEIDPTISKILDKSPDISLTNTITHIGWEKNRKISGLLSQIALIKSQELEKQIIPDMAFQSYLANEMFTLAEKDIYRKSKELEPSVKQKREDQVLV